MSNDGAVMRVLKGDRLPVDFVAHLHADLFGPALNRPPFFAEMILAVRNFFLVNVGSIGTAGGHGNRDVAAVAQRRKWQTDDRGSRVRQLAAIDTHLVKAEF